MGQMSLLEALMAPARLGYEPAMGLVGYWLSHDSHVNEPLLEVIRRLKATGVTLYLATNQEHMRAQWLWQTLKFGEL